MSGQRHTIYPITFGYSTAQVLEISQLESMELDTGVTETPIIPGGATNPLVYVTPRARPTGRFGTRDLAGFFSGVSPTVGLHCDEPSTWRLQQRSDDAAGFAVGNAHVTWTAARGVLVPETLSAEIDAEDGALLQANFWPLSPDSATSPLAFQEEVDLAGAPAVAFSSLFFLASAYHNGVEIPGVQSSRVDFGFTLQPSPATPGTYDSLISKITQIPELSFMCAKADEEAVMAVIGEAVNTSFSLYYQKSDPDNDRIAKNVAEHIRVSCTAGRYIRRTIRGEGTADVMVEFVTRPTGVISVNAASIIP